MLHIIGRARPVIVDLFGGAGVAALGYHEAGFEVIGVDNDPRAIKRYPFESHCGDWLHLAERLLHRADAFHASPPCQAYSVTKHSHSVQHPELIEPVREFLQSTGLPYVIENVVGAPLIDPLTLCGTMFGLEAQDDDGTLLYLKRHRLFESNVPLAAPGPCRCLEFRRSGRVCGGVYGGGSSDRAHAKHVRRGGYTPANHVRQALMGGVTWTTQAQLCQAIPPAYTRWVGRQVLLRAQTPQVLAS